MTFMNRHLWAGWYRTIVFIFLLSLITVSSSAQALAIKSNIPYLATGSFNSGLEIGLSPKLTLGVEYGINPFVFNENKKWRHWLVQPEMRYWLCERFYGHFLGLHVGATEYNLSRVRIPTVKNAQNHRYEGWAALGGLSYGYTWILGGQWNMEATLGLGVVYTDYKKFECPECGKLLAKESKTFVAPTKVAVSIIYLLK